MFINPTEVYDAVNLGIISEQEGAEYVAEWWPDDESLKDGGSEQSQEEDEYMPTSKAGDTIYNQFRDRKKESVTDKLARSFKNWNEERKEKIGRTRGLQFGGQ